MDKKPIGAQIHQTASCIDNFIQVYLCKNSTLHLTAMEGMTLKYIAHFEGKPLIAKDIMEFTKLSKATTSQTLCSMENKGLIKMTEKNGDKRAKEISLTDKGREKITEFIDFFKKINEILEKDFTAEEKAQLQAMLEKIKNNISTTKGGTL